MVTSTWDAPNLVNAYLPVFAVVLVVWVAILVVCGLVFYVSLKRWDREDAEERRKLRLRDLTGGER